MIATHNIKVNGRWYRAGEVIPETKPVKAEKKEEPKTAAVQEVIPMDMTPAEESIKAEEPAKEEKPRGGSRRRKISE